MEEYFKFFKDLFGTNLINSTSNKKIEKLLLNNKSLVTFSKKDNIEDVDVITDVSKLFNIKLISLTNNLVYIYKLDYDVEKKIFYKRLSEAFIYSENSLKKILSSVSYLIELENMFCVLGKNINIVDKSYE